MSLKILKPMISKNVKDFVKKNLEETDKIKSENIKIEDYVYF